LSAVSPSPCSGFGLATERDLERRIDLIVFIVVGTTQFGLTTEEDLQLKDLQLRLYCTTHIYFAENKFIVPSSVGLNLRSSVPFSVCVLKEAVKGKYRYV